MFKYKLKGVVVHMGNADWGHYYSLIKKDEDWLEFNDQLVTKFDINNLPNETFGGEEKVDLQNVIVTKDMREKNKNSYILLYEKIVKSTIDNK